MRILHVIASTDLRLGGPVEAIRQVSAAVDKMGHSSEIVCLDPPDSPWFKDLGVAVHVAGTARGGTYGYSPQLVPWLRRHSGQYDCVIVHGLWTFATTATRRALRGTQIPYFVYPHGMLDPVFRNLHPVKHVKKCLYWLLVEHRVLRDAAAVLFTCDEEQALASQSFWPRKWESAVVSHCVNGPSEEDFGDGLLNKYPELRGKRLILFLSRIHPKKGCDLLIEAFARVAAADPALHLIMAGPAQLPQWAERLKARAKELGIADRITWTGMLTGQDKWDAFRDAEVFILPSHQENFGIAVTEALACGTPVLITRRINIWREIHADGAGLVADAGLEGTIELLNDWLALDPATRQSMRTNAAKCFATRFDAQRAAQTFIDTLTAFSTAEKSLRQTAARTRRYVQQPHPST